MAVLTGCNGALADLIVTTPGTPPTPSTAQFISTTKNWTLSESRTLRTYRASNTQCATGKLPGILSITGSYLANGAVPAKLPGETFEFFGYTAPNSGVTGGVGACYAMTSIVDSVAITWPFDTGDSISHVVNFTGTTALLGSTSTPTAMADHILTDDSDVNLADVCVTKVEMSNDEDATGEWVEVSDITSAVLTMTRENKTYINSSTSCLEAKIAGSLDWTLTLPRQDTKWIIPSGIDRQFRMYVDGATFWLLKWGIIKEHTGLTVDIEGDEIVSYTKNIEMQPLSSGGTGSGSILRPDTSQYWPFTE